MGNWTTFIICSGGNATTSLQNQSYVNWVTLVNSEKISSFLWQSLRPKKTFTWKH